MINTKGNHAWKPFRRLLLLGLALVLAAGMLVLAAGERTPSGGSAPPAGTEPAPFDVNADAYAPSLEMREQVDFLLTPAFLVQDAITSGTIMTYPCE